LKKGTSHLKEQTQTILQGDELLRLIPETVPDMITVWDSGLTLIYASPSVRETLGYDEEDLKKLLNNSGGSGWTRLVAPGSIPSLRAAVKGRLKRNETPGRNERNHTVELELIRRDGSTLWTETASNPLPGGNGERTGFIAVTRDISQRKLTREMLIKSEERYRNILENIEECYFELDHAGNFTFFNDALCRMTGYTAEELSGMNNRVYTSPETAQRLYATFKQIYATGRPATVEHYEVIRKDGTIRINDLSASLLLDGSGNPIGFRGVARDITEHTERERELKESYENLERMLEETVRTLAFTVEVRDPYTAGHQRRVAQLADAISHKMGLSSKKAMGVRMAALIHDVGKIQIPGELLNKPGPLSAYEMDLVKSHPSVGSSILKEIQFPWPISDIVLQHHARLDGSGYPRDIGGEQMSVEAKIIAVADVVEAMVSHRPYRSALGLEKAIEEISSNRGTLYDPQVVDTCLSLITGDDFIFE
jgi:PAS domain S-box-containing protein/putative nucleotidyltransferase with HDIG domain